MNKLINRISPETSENRILHAGFSIILMSEEITQTLSGLSSDMIIFILSGSITIYSTKEEKKTIGEQYMIFLRSFENYTYDITLGSKIIIFFFDSLTMNELPYYQHPYGILPQPISKWIELKIVEPLYGFLELVGQYLENNFLNYPLYELKRTELFYLLKKLYRKEELDYFFYLSSTHSAEFERLIAENYIKAKTVTDLAQMIGYGVNSFRMKFKKVFGINIILQKRVVDYKDGNVFLDDGQTIPTRTLLWVSGVKAVHFDHIEGELLTRGERIIVNECNQVKGLSNIFAIGDVCWMAEPDYPNGHPQVAQVAIQQGELLAENLQRIEALKKPRPFHYKNLGTLATVGRNKAVADLNKVKLHGFTAWLVWMLVHLRSILGIKNKLIVLIDWIWNYFTYDRSMRFILFIQKHKQDGTQGTEPTL